MSNCYICDMCCSSIDAREVNIVSFFERYTDINSADKVLVADPRLMLCDNCFSFLKDVVKFVSLRYVKQAQTVTIDDIEKEA